MSSLFGPFLNIKKLTLIEIKYNDLFKRYM